MISPYAPIAALARRLRARAAREDRRRVRYPIHSEEAGECRGRGLSYVDVAEQLEAMLSEEP